ncbi:acyl-CoA reductase [Micromonospora sp. CV4]|uniref:acyl-CoA reductase n=1 Tax=Micromonospora sp. CV4 TaxID=2478711 RepID=UPI000EF4D59D|nr:acyl-CoA reductase [Micromonospora sp. CV4]RLP95537.1 gamma-glutamyl phosphate reductase [Micromonospora sp. CV4]
MTVRMRFPAGPELPVDEVVPPPPETPLTVGDERIMDFLTAVSRRLLTPALARRHPELGSLGFFLRRRELLRGVERLRAGLDERVLAFPRGVVFHVPPANVDTIFVYSWALAALAGNINVVRVSPRSAAAADAILEVLNDSLAEADPVVARTQRMVTYGHDDAVTARLSADCDVRVIWGGDRAVTTVRRHPLAPAARDLTFPDRSSFAVLSIAGWEAAPVVARRDAVAKFANDAYWFDQAACSSPRAVFLVGDAARADAVRAEFVALLGVAARNRGSDVDAAMAVEKRVGSYGLAADGGVSRMAFPDNLVATLELDSPAAVPREWLGTGTFGFVTIAELAELVPFLRRRDQTLTHFGFDPAELVGFARELGGRGIDRIVPFGAALNFAPVWDGYDLLREFVRLVSVDG